MSFVSLNNHTWLCLESASIQSHLTQTLKIRIVDSTTIMSSHTYACWVTRPRTQHSHTRVGSRDPVPNTHMCVLVPRVPGLYKGPGDRGARVPGSRYFPPKKSKNLDLGFPKGRLHQTERAGVFHLEKVKTLIWDSPQGDYTRRKGQVFSTSTK